MGRCRLERRSLWRPSALSLKLGSVIVLSKPTGGVLERVRDGGAEPPRGSRALEYPDGGHRRQAGKVVGVGKIEHPQPDRWTPSNRPPFRRHVDCRIRSL